MRIGIASFFNPSEIKDYLFEGQEIPNIFIGLTSVNTIIKELLCQGHQLIIFSYGAINKKKIVLNGPMVKVIIINHNYGIKGLTVLSRLYMVGKLKRVIASEIENIDILHAHWTYDFALASKAFCKYVPVFCSVRDWCPYIIKCQRRLSDKVYWAISWFVFERVMKGNHIKFIANSQYTFEKIVERYPNKEVAIIPNPISKESIVRRDYLPNRVHSFIAISQYADDKRKNYDNLLHAYKKFHFLNPESKLCLVGGGFSKDSALIKKWEQANLLDGVELIGQLSHNDLLVLIDSCSCLVHPSLEETFGNTLIEGMARCKPVIGGAFSGAVPYVLGFGKYGILCDVRNIDSIVSALTDSLDEVYCAMIVKKATDYLISSFSSDAVVKQHISLYQQFTKKQ